jgi:hypothetical protein
LDADPDAAMGPGENPTMISIYRCRLENDQWTSVERHHTGRGFTTMAEAVEFAEALNSRTWPKFDWLSEPVKAYSRSALKRRSRPCEADDVDGARKEE